MLIKAIFVKMKKIKEILCKLSFLIIGVLLPSVIVLSCQKSERRENQVRLKLIEDSVYAHYSKEKDSLKRKAAEFLFKNIPYHFSFSGSILDNYYKDIIRINTIDNFENCIDAYNNYIDTLNTDNFDIEMVYDTDVISAEYIISNIDEAFDVWRNGKWASHLDFEDFCEYLLPYRIGNEQICNWREDARSEYLHTLDWMDSEDDKSYSTYWAALNMNESIKHHERRIYKTLHLGGIDFPYWVLKRMKIGECIDNAHYAVYVMRSCGIPVSIDFTPQWPFRSNGHYWNTLLDSSGKNIPFMGGGSNPGYPCKAGYLLAKVYRKTFAYQEGSLAALNKKIGENIPPALNDPFMKDVTDEYLKGVSLKLILKERRKNHFLYLSVFDNSKWIPICFSGVSKLNTATFENIGTGIVYLPVYWNRHGPVPASCPIEIRKNRDIKFLIPDRINRHTITMNRKFPIFSGVKKYGERMHKGQFHASNDVSFSSFKKCARIEHVPHMRYDSIEIKEKEKYRYWRYMSPTWGLCNVAEIKFFFADKQIPVKCIISDNRNAKGFSPTMAFDNDELTYYESVDEKGNWIGVDFGMPVKVDKIVFIPRNDDNNITIGHTYQLDFYNEVGEVECCGQVTASQREVTFHDVPQNALYILHDLTKGKEERIFTYMNNQVMWY